MRNTVQQYVVIRKDGAYLSSKTGIYDQAFSFDRCILFDTLEDAQNALWDDCAVEVIELEEEK